MVAALLTICVEVASYPAALAGEIYRASNFGGTSLGGKIFEFSETRGHTMSTSLLIEHA
jgi:predicted aconitase with swiveling domain